jgi:hypothetical protein
VTTRVPPPPPLLAPSRQMRGTLVAAAAAVAVGINNGKGITPPMGWRDWNQYQVPVPARAAGRGRRGAGAWDVVEHATWHRCMRLTVACVLVCVQGNISQAIMQSGEVASPAAQARAGREDG